MSYPARAEGLVNMICTNQESGGDDPSYNIVKIIQNSKKSRENLMGVAVTQTPVKNNQLTLV